ncbi:MAG: hypothetical protein E7656_03785 [Ruminococcaceae bacterium]|nr:hypothetical protein [Oscillospiraceae bacterium]
MKKIKTNICIIGDTATECIAADSERTAFDGFSFVCCRINEEMTFNLHVVDEGNVSYVVIEKDREKVEIRANAYVDATSDVRFARNAGCEHRLLKNGEEKECFKLLKVCDARADNTDLPDGARRTGEFSNLFVMMGE